MAELSHPQPPAPNLPSHSLLQILQEERTSSFGLQIGKQVEVDVARLFPSEKGALREIALLKLL